MSPDIEMNPYPLFLETTIQIERVIGPQNERDKIRLSVKGHRVCTSGHVLGEYKRTLIQDAIVFLNLVKTSPNVGEAVKRLAKYRPYGRKFSRTMTLLETLGRDGDKENTIDRLEQFIEWRAIDYFWEDVDRSYFRDEVRCVLRSWQPEVSGDGSYNTDGLRCLKNNPPHCEIKDFICDHKDDLEMLAVAVCRHERTNVRRAAQALTSILADDDVPFGERSNCPAISDALIVLEAPSEAAIYTTDGDVKAICAVLGRRTHRVDPLKANA